MESSKQITSSLVNYDVQIIYQTLSLLWRCCLYPILQFFFSSKRRTYTTQRCYSTDRYIQRNTQRIALTGAIRRTSREKLYQKLGLESPQQRRWHWKWCSFYKISKNQASYLYNLIPTSNQINRAKNADVVPHLNPLSGSVAII